MATLMYYLDTPPEYTIPYYDHIPRRPRGTHLSAALYPLTLSSMDDIGCHKLPENNPWHPPSHLQDDCGKGFVIYVSRDTQLRLLAAPGRGSGCNNNNGLECAPIYPLLLPLKEGRNNIIWCTEASIQMARPNALDPWQELCSDYGTVLFVPPRSQGTLQNYVYEGNTYAPIKSAPHETTQPTIMSKARCAAPNPPRISLFVPNGEAPSLKILSLIKSGLCCESRDSLPYPGALSTNVIGLRRRVHDHAITPPKCLCGIEYVQMEEDYTTGDVPGPVAAHY